MKLNFPGRPPFTLIELLFVVAIVGILVGIMLPTLIRSKAQARKTACLSNLKQLYLATKMYSDDYKTFPSARRSIGVDAKSYWCAEYDGSKVDPLTGLLYPYFQNRYLLLCPEFTVGCTPMDPEYGPACSYGMNGEYVGGDPGKADPLSGEPARPEDIADPSRTLLLMDAAEAQGTALAESFLFWAEYSYFSGASQSALSHYRHSSLAAGSFCDGHAADVWPDAIADRALRLGWPARELCDRE
jgi:prepilin-type N-terminal cleavage/methylation domain-containing protein/prepilin-type processing-associated H-X9-DG protein